MPPQKFTAADPESVRSRYKVVRRDTMQDVPGLILAADAGTGLCLLRGADGASQQHSFGPNGLSIVPSAR